MIFHISFSLSFDFLYVNFLVSISDLLKLDIFIFKNNAKNWDINFGIAFLKATSIL